MSKQQRRARRDKQSRTVVRALSAAKGTYVSEPADPEQTGVETSDKQPKQSSKRRRGAAISSIIEQVNDADAVDDAVDQADTRGGDDAGKADEQSLFGSTAVEDNPTSSGKRWAKRFGWSQAFAALSFVILLGSTVYWSVLSARLQAYNADQLIDAYMFGSPSTFHDALFPGAHTFLLKWPIFALMSVFGQGQAVFMVATIVLSVVTVGALAAFLYRIERRPLGFAVLCLGLASVLLLVPAQPYPGALLPVNMAMTTTRNLEYVVYLLMLYIGIRMSRLPGKVFWLVTVGMALVIASDKLFIVLSVGGALFACAWAALIRHRDTETVHLTRWLVAALVATTLASVMLYAINASGLTHLVNDQAASPYAMIHSVRSAVNACLYGIMGFLTNFGANPAHSALLLRQIPSAFFGGLKSFSAISYIVNIAIVVWLVYAAARILVIRRTDRWNVLATGLIGSFLAVAVIFVLTDHYYPVDARYLTIGLFAFAIAGATYLRELRLQPKIVTAVAALLLVSVSIGCTQNHHEYQQSQQALASKINMTHQVSDAMTRGHISRLVGDYWNVTPVKAVAAQKMTIAPIDQCKMPHAALNSKAWFKQPAATSTAYLAVRDPLVSKAKSLEGQNVTYGGCTLAKILGMYGLPSQRLALGDTKAGAAPADVLLLMYPKGTATPAAIKAGASDQTTGKTSQDHDDMAAPLVPTVESLSSEADCSQGSSLQVVAHEDDDILFMNPDVIHDAKAGKCVRTVYVTAGDAGSTAIYWAGREQGSKAAYAAMMDAPDVWHDERQTLDGHAVTVSTLEDNPRIGLVFMHLPDGNIRGQGFASTHEQSLAGLYENRIQTLASVDGSTTYTRQQLIETIQSIITLDTPGQIRTLGSSNLVDGDHSDHHTVGQFVDAATTNFSSEHSLDHYIGYPGRERPVNLSEADIADKMKLFLAYAKYDAAVCQTEEECDNTYTYGGYIRRQYVSPSQHVEASPASVAAASASEPKPSSASVSAPTAVDPKSD